MIKRVGEILLKLRKDGFPTWTFVALTDKRNKRMIFMSKHRFAH